MAERRLELRFASYEDVIADIENLAAGEYERTGGWTLGQICRHLSYYFRGSLEGFSGMLPWIVRVTVGRMALGGMLREPIRKAGGATAPRSVFPADSVDRPAVDEAIALLRRLSVEENELHPSALFGQLTSEQWRKVHLNHASHHLSFLVRA